MSHITFLPDDGMSLFFCEVAVVEVSRHQIFGRYTAQGDARLSEDWTGTCPTLGKLLVVKMSDGSWTEASTGQALSWSEVEVTPTFSWFELVGGAGLRFLPAPAEQLVAIGMVSDWRAAALHEGNLSRAIGA